jgi:UDP:flavonoid glycosyltransferase YjiC (YdhE family)
MKVGLQSWGSEGDIQPFTALAAGLVKRGHDVTLVVTDNVGRDYSALAERFGYRLVPVPNPVMTSADEVERIWRQIIELGNPIRQAEVVMKYGFDPVADAMYEAARELCANNQAVVGHFFAYPLQVAAQKIGRPSATVNIVHNCLPSRTICPPGLPNLGRWTYPLGWQLVRSMINRIFLPRVNALRVKEGLSPDRDVMLQTWSAERLNLIGVSPQICQRPPDWEDRHQICGFLNPPAPLESEVLPPGLDEFLAAGDPPVYLTFGSMMLSNLDYLREVFDIWMEAVQQVGCRAVLQLPWNDLGAFGSTDKVFKVRRSPYTKVFPRCALVVHHGGAGTTQAALLAGRPSIIVAHVSDQFFWGSEIERLGAGGRTLRRKGIRASALARDIAETMSRPELGRKALEIGRRMAAENGVSTAVTLIEQRLGSK